MFKVENNSLTKYNLIEYVNKSIFNAGFLDGIPISNNLSDTGVSGDALVYNGTDMILNSSIPRDDKIGTSKFAGLDYNSPDATNLVYYQSKKISPSDGEVTNKFGVDVSTSADGRYIGISMPISSSGLPAYLNIYYYNGISWVEQAKLNGPTSVGFGNEISMSADGKYVIVGASVSPGSDGANRNGAAYIYVRDGEVWSEQQKLRSDDISSNVYFGSSVSISADSLYAVVGANVTDKVYIYKRTLDSWSLLQKIVASDAGDNNFGYSAVITGDALYIAVGSDEEDDSGAVYIFHTTDRITWTQQSKLKALDANTGDYFGYSVDITPDGSRVVVGAYKTGTNVGSVYVFGRIQTSWTQEQKLSANQVADNMYFGRVVSITADGQYILTSSTINDYGINYIYKRNITTWTQYQKLQTYDQADSFAWSGKISADGKYIVSGAPATTEGSTGDVFVFEARESNVVEDISVNTTTTDTITMGADNVLILTNELTGNINIVLPINGLINGRKFHVIIQDGSADSRELSFTPDVIGWTDGTVLSDGYNNISMIWSEESGLFYKI